jgi:hypothetical protein
VDRLLQLENISPEQRKLYLKLISVFQSDENPEIVKMATAAIEDLGGRFMICRK